MIKERAFVIRSNNHKFMVCEITAARRCILMAANSINRFNQVYRHALNWNGATIFQHSGISAQLESFT